jgi:hypothetical protein
MLRRLQVLIELPDAAVKHLRDEELEAELKQPLPRSCGSSPK